MSEPDLSDQEKIYLRQMIILDKRVKWAMAMARRLALWITAVAVAVISTKDMIISLITGGKH